MKNRPGTPGAMAPEKVFVNFDTCKSLLYKYFSVKVKAGCPEVRPEWGNSLGRVPKTALPAGSTRVAVTRSGIKKM
jgi:hypothetical protein